LDSTRVAFSIQIFGTKSKAFCNVLEVIVECGGVQKVDENIAM
jgi:hypothetical protein